MVADERILPERAGPVTDRPAAVKSLAVQQLFFERDDWLLGPVSLEKDNLETAFDAVLRDPHRRGWLDRRTGSIDGIHPGVAGMKRMAELIPLDDL